MIILSWICIGSIENKLRKKRSSGAPGEIRTPGLLLRRTSLTQNQQVSGKNTRCDGVLQRQCLCGCPQGAVALRLTQSGLVVGTKLGTVGTRLCGWKQP